MREAGVVGVPDGQGERGSVRRGRRSPESADESELLVVLPSSTLAEYKVPRRIEIRDEPCRGARRARCASRLEDHRGVSAQRPSRKQIVRIVREELLARQRQRPIPLDAPLGELGRRARFAGARQAAHGGRGNLRHRAPGRRLDCSRHAFASADARRFRRRLRRKGGGCFCRGSRPPSANFFTAPWRRAADALAGGGVGAPSSLGDRPAHARAGQAVPACAYASELRARAASRRHPRPGASRSHRQSIDLRPICARRRRTTSTVSGLHSPNGMAAPFLAPIAT